MPCRRTGWPKRFDYIVFFLVVGYFLSGANAVALETTLGVAAGYDDNPAEVSQGDGTGLARYEVQLSQPLLNPSSAASLDIFVDAVYSQYFSFGDNCSLRAGGSYYPDYWFERIGAGVFVEGTLYRDDLMPEDEYDSLLVGGELEWLVDARLTLILQPTFSRVDYRNEVSLPGQRTVSSSKGQGRGAGGSQPDTQTEWTRYSRSDTIWSAEMTATYSLSPDIQTDVAILYRDLNATDAVDSFRETGAALTLFWYYSEFGELYVSGYGSKLDFDAALDGGTRSDDLYGVGLGVSRWWGPLEMFGTYDRTVNDSPITGEDYKKSVVICGVSYSF
jgi:hypothetical protein